MIKRIHIGSNNKLSIEKEFRFEVVCPIEKVKMYLFHCVKLPFCYNWFSFVYIHCNNNPVHLLQLQSRDRRGFILLVSIQL